MSSAGLAVAVWVVALCFLLQLDCACGTATVTAANTVDYSCLHAYNWLMNSGGSDVSTIFTTVTATGTTVSGSAALTITSSVSVPSSFIGATVTCSTSGVIQTSTVISSISGAVVTLSKTATLAGTSLTITFTPTTGAPTDITDSYYTTSGTSFDMTATYLIGSHTSTQNAWVVTSSRIPKYGHTFTTAEITKLNSRTNKDTDFTTNSATTAEAGTYYEWGADIGYNTASCSTGWWPPGPTCPTATLTSEFFPLMPLAETVVVGNAADGGSTSGGTAIPGCYVGAGSMGWWVNGAKIYGWGDGKGFNFASSYSSATCTACNVDNTLATWHNLAPSFEDNDMDVCSGHAASGDYHSHNYPNCMATRLGDTGTGHSPLYGWIYDGFPVYGPYQSSGVLAQSCWLKRDYSTSGGTGGCSTTSSQQRTCLLNNIYDVTAGVTAISDTTRYGPKTTDTLVTQSGNTITAASGVFLEDYYYSASCYATGSQYLDMYNGHDHDGLGYHYHTTVDSSMTPTFPFIVGPKYKGCIKGAACNDLPAGSSVWLEAGPTRGWTGGSISGTGTSTKSACVSSVPSSSAVMYAMSQGTTTQGCTSYNIYPTGQPTRQPSRQPSRQPTSKPSRQPTRQPTGRPTGQPTSKPSRRPTQQPTSKPTGQPSRRPSRQPTRQPTSKPTRQPSRQPSGQPTRQPSSQPSRQPTGQPTGKPNRPTGQPSRRPSGQPTRQPTTQPTRQPTRRPTRQPTGQPTGKPSRKPTPQPTTPTVPPTVVPTPQPSPMGVPTPNPTQAPTALPTLAPTAVTMSSASISVSLSGISGVARRLLQQLRVSRALGVTLSALDFRQALANFLGISVSMIGEPQVSSTNRKAIASKDTRASWTDSLLRSDSFSQAEASEAHDRALAAPLNGLAGLGLGLGLDEPAWRKLQSGVTVTVVISGTSATVNIANIASAMSNATAFASALSAAAGVPITVSYLGIADVSPTFAPTPPPTIPAANKLYIISTAVIGGFLVLAAAGLAYWCYYVREKHLDMRPPRFKPGVAITHDEDFDFDFDFGTKTTHVQPQPQPQQQQQPQPQPLQRNGELGDIEMKERSAYSGVVGGASAGAGYLYESVTGGASAGAVYVAGGVGLVSGALMSPFSLFGGSQQQPPEQQPGQRQQEVREEQLQAEVAVTAVTPPRRPRRRVLAQEEEETPPSTPLRSDP